MAKKENAFTPEFTIAMDRLSVLFHGSAASNWVMKQATKIGRKTLEEAKNDGKKYPHGVFGLGTNLLFYDYNRMKDGKRKFRDYKSHSASDEALLSLAQEMERRTQAQVLVAAFETLEIHLKRVARQTLFQMRNDAGEKKVKIPFEKNKFHLKQKKWQSKEYKQEIGQPAYFNSYVHSHYQYGMGQFLGELQNGLPFCEEEHNALFMGVARSHYEIIEFCRHQIVHNFGAYAAKKIAKFEKHEQDAIAELTMLSFLEGVPTILPDANQTKNWIESFAATALHVHRGVSDAFDMNPAM